MYPCLAIPSRVLIREMSTLRALVECGNPTSQAVVGNPSTGRNAVLAIPSGICLMLPLRLHVWRGVAEHGALCSFVLSYTILIQFVFYA